jgi:hypothetical protein
MTRLVAVIMMLLAGTSCGSSGQQRAIQTLGPAVLTALPVIEATAEAAEQTQTAEQWPVLNGVAEVTFTVDGDTRTFTGGYCRATEGEGVGSQVVVFSGDEAWLAPLHTGLDGEGMELTANWPYDLDGFRIEVRVGDNRYLMTEQQVASVEERHTAVALSTDLRSGTFQGQGWTLRGGEQVWATISGSFECK